MKEAIHKCMDIAETPDTLPFSAPRATGRSR